MKVLLLENPHEGADELFAQDDIEVIRVTGSLGESDLIEAIKDVDMVGIRSKTELTRKVIEAAPRLEAIGAYCIGTNQIDLKAATERGIAVFNAPYSNTRSVVEMAISELVALARRIPSKNANLQRGLWQKSASGSHEVRGRTLGIVGYGNIGTQLSVLAEAMGMNVIFYDIAEVLAMGNAKPMGSLEELLAQADFVSLHVDGRPENKSMFTAREFAQMKPGSIFLNLSRGTVADQEALAQALKSGHLAGAGVDVFWEEPKKNGEPFNSPLLGIDNVILTPHIGGSTLEAQEDIGRFTTNKLRDYMKSGNTDMSVNLPRLSPSSSQFSGHRIGLIHRNTPGVMAHINQLFAQHGANIDAQILATSGQVGYALADISSELPQDAIDEVLLLPETIRLRIMH